MCVDVDPGLKSIHLAPGPGVDSSPSPDAGPSAPPRQHRSHRSGGARDDRYRSGTTNTLTLALSLHSSLSLGADDITGNQHLYIACMEIPAEHCKLPTRTETEWVKVKSALPFLQHCPSDSSSLILPFTCPLPLPLFSTAL